jgi:hypothetical protein
MGALKTVTDDKNVKFYWKNTRVRYQHALSLEKYRKSNCECGILLPLCMADKRTPDLSNVTEGKVTQRWLLLRKLKKEEKPRCK